MHNIATKLNESQRAQIQELIEQQAESIFTEMQNLDWNNPAVYGSWLRQTFAYVNHATRVLALAAAHCKHTDSELHELCLRGINEERDHEKLAESDLNTMDLSLDSFSELPETSAYYQTLYYSISHKSPYSLLGYFFVLEGLGGLKLGPTARQLQKIYGENAVKFLEEHCILDVNHYAKGLEFLKNCPANEFSAIEEAVILSGQLYKSIIVKINENSKKTSKVSHSSTSMMNNVI